MSCHLFVIILWENMGLGYVHFCAVIRRYWYVIIGAGVNILPHAAVRCHVFSSCRSWKWVDKLKRPSLRHCRGRRACVLHVLDLGTSLFSFEIVGWGGRVGFGGCVRVSLLRTHFLLSG